MRTISLHPQIIQAGVMDEPIAEKMYPSGGYGTIYVGCE